MQCITFLSVLVYVAGSTHKQWCHCLAVACLVTHWLVSSHRHWLQLL